MKTKFPLKYTTIERIKAEEYELFFNSLENYDLYLNHLGEIRWMTSTEARQQHEFFIYERNRIQQLKKNWRLRHSANLDKISPPERELRLQIRQYLEKKYLKKLREETRSRIPETWQYEFSVEDIKSIPIALSFYQRGISPKTILIALLFFFAIVISASYLIHKVGTKDGSIFITSNVEGGRVYMDDDQFLGYTEKILSRIPPGIHRFSVQKYGYQAIPPSQTVTILADSVTAIRFNLEQIQAQVTGFLRVGAEEPRSQLVVDNKVYGEINSETVIPLKEGIHKISIRKKGYLSIPGERVIRISPGDTSLFVVEQTLISKIHGNANTTPGKRRVGSLSVNSNVLGADIYIDGRKTGRQTDYVFPGLSFGSHEIRVQKEGYTSSSGTKTIVLSSGKPKQNVSFNLSKNFETVTISVLPRQAPFFLDGKFIGKGQFQGDLPIGTHTLKFGPLEGYKTPEPRQIQVSPAQPLRLTIKYFPDLYFRAEVGNSGNVRTENCEIKPGFNFSNRGFTPSNERGPEIVFSKILQDYFWKLGFAFPYKNDRGNDALMLNFVLPRDLNFRQKFTLKLTAGASRQKYPRSLSSKVRIKIKINGTILSYYYQPKYIEDTRQLEPQSWDITSAVKPGRNILEISTTQKNHNYYYIKRIEIHN